MVQASRAEEVASGCRTLLILKGAGLESSPVPKLSEVTSGIFARAD